MTTIQPIDLPPPPATVAEAVASANQIAYGFAKHVDLGYWDRYLSDPLYFWKRLLGWQAGESDRAVYGLYAVPPSAWNVPFVVLPVPPPEPAPQSDVLAALTLARLNQIDARLTALESRLTDLVDGLAGDLLHFEVVQKKGLTGKIFGYTITLTPTP